MPYTTEETETAVVLTPEGPANAAIIWLHGLGADGYDFVPIAQELKLPTSLSPKFIFPHAKARPVTINNGYVMRAWYDIQGFSAVSVEDDAGIRDSQRVIEAYIEQATKSGIPPENIVLAGFSQGGAMALHTGLRYQRRLAGILALSTYLPLRGSVASEANSATRDTPIFMCHGVRDQVVPHSAGSASRDLLNALGYSVRWKSYPMEHQVSMEEIGEISLWLQEILRRNN